MSTSDDLDSVLRTDARALGKLAVRMEALGLPDAIDVRALSEEAAALLRRRKDLRSGDISATVAVAGAFNSGKSSFVNRVLGEEICPVDACPTTSSSTRFRYSPKREIVMVTPGPKGRQKRRLIAMEQYRRMVSHSRRGKAPGGPIFFEFLGKFPLLRKIDLVDTPGFENPKNPYDQTVTEVEMRQADVLFYLIDVNQGTVTGSGLETLEAIRADAPDAPVYLVINKADTKPAAARERVLRRSEDDYHKYFRRCILFCSSPGRDLPGTTSIGEVRGIFDEIVRDKLAMLGGGLRNECHAYQMRRNVRLVACRRSLHRVRDSLNGNMTGLRRTQEAVSSWAKRQKRILASEFGELAASVANAALEAVEIEATGRFFNEARVRLDSGACLRSFNRGAIWAELKGSLDHRMLQALAADQRKQLVKEWSRHLSTAKRESYRAFVSALRTDMASSFDDEYSSLNGAEAALSRYLEGLIESPEGLSEPACNPVNRAIQAIERKLKSAIAKRLSGIGKTRNEMQAILKGLCPLVRAGSAR